MNIVFYLISGFLVFLGLFGISQLWSLPTLTVSDLKQIVIGFVVLSWGVALAAYRANSYRGGTTSIIGYLLLGVGFYAGAGDILWQSFATQKETYTSMFASLFLITSGAILLWQGHKVHLLKSKTENT